MFSRALLFYSLFIMSLVSPNLGAETNESTLFLEGHSPVSYFTVGKAEKGNADFSVQHKGKLYYLTSAEQLELFNENPEKYTPLFEVCPYSLSLGKKVPLDPTIF